MGGGDMILEHGKRRTQTIEMTMMRGRASTAVSPLDALGTCKKFHNRTAD